MSTALSVWLTAAASSTVGTANKLYATSGGSPATTQTYSLLGTAAGYGEVCSQGATGAWLAGGSIGAPTGKGFFLDLATLDGQDLLSGAFTGNVRFASATGTGGTLGGTLVADIYYRVYKYSSGTYTSIISMSSLTQTINSTLTTYALSGSTGSNTSFATGDKLYVDVWLNVTTNANGATENIRLNRLTTDTSTFVGDTAATIVTPGFQPSGGTQSIAESVTQTEIITTFRYQTQAIIESVTQTESIAAFNLVRQSIAESVTQTEIITTSIVNIVTQSIAESVTQTEIIAGVASTRQVIAESVTQTESIVAISLAVSPANAQMQIGDLTTQYARILASVAPTIKIIATVYYGSSNNSTVIAGEIDVLLIGEDITQLHILKTINDVTAFI